MCNKLKQSKTYQTIKHMGQKYASRALKLVSKINRYFLLAFIFVIGIVVFISSHSHMLVGIVDMERLREMAKPYQEIEREKEKYTQIWRTKFRAEQDVLDAEDKKLAEAQKKKNMKKKDFQKALDNLQKKSLLLQKKYQKEASKIMMATESAQSQVDALATQALQELAEKFGYDLVLSEHVLYASRTIDITDDLIDELNKTTVKINYPDPETLTPDDE